MADLGITGTKYNNVLDRMITENSEGIIPDSRKRVRITFPGGGNTLGQSQSYTFDATGLNTKTAMIGSSLKLILECTATKNDGSDILAADPISLQAEASNLAWRQIQMYINDSPVTSCDRSDVIRHTIDRYYVMHNEEAMQLKRQLFSDSATVTNATAFTPLAYSQLFNKEMIEDKKRFNLVRPLTDLPMCAQGDSFIPGFNTIRIDAQTSSQPSALFQTDVSITAEPLLKIVNVILEYDTIRFEDQTAIDLEELFLGGVLTIKGDLWESKKLTPDINIGTKDWQQSNDVVVGTVPDVVHFIQFKDTDITPSSTYYNQPGFQLLHRENNISAFRYYDGTGQCVLDYKQLGSIGSKIDGKLTLDEAVQQGGGNVEGSSSLLMGSSVDETTFVAQDGFGCVPLIYRNWGEKFTHKTEGIKLTATAEFNYGDTGADFHTKPYYILKSRRTWVLKQGDTRIIK